MNGQIVLSTMDTLKDVDIREVCINASQWAVQQEAFRETTIHLAYFCLATAAIIGFISGYIYAKRKYGDI